MPIKGKRAKKPAATTTAVPLKAVRVGEQIWRLNDSVWVSDDEVDTGQWSGMIQQLEIEKVLINPDDDPTEDGPTWVTYDRLKTVDDDEPPEPEAVVDGEDDDSDSSDDSKAFGGFNQYGVKWDKTMVNFKAATTEGIDFYGWWRKMEVRGSDQVAYAIDMFARRIIDKVEREFTIDSLTYVDVDPRKSIKSLNADICAAMNQWFHRNLHDNANNLDQLYKQAKHPTLYLTRIGSMDALILRLKEFRETAIRCGGSRLFEMTGDKPGPTIHVVVNVTDQAIMLEGKVPRIKGGHGSIIDHAAETKGKDPGRAKTATSTPMEGNVKSLVERLKSTKDRGEARKLRAVLRKMGHSGGARGGE